MAKGHSLQVYRGDRPNKYVLGSQGNLLAALPLRDGRYLDVRMGLAIYGTPDGRRLKVDQSVFQYQSDAGGDGWIFRYEYNRHPVGSHPPMHFHIRGKLTENCLRAGESLERIHFPATRVSLEAVIRLLVDQFHVPPVLKRSELRKLVTQTEREFLNIAHRAVSGRTR